MSVRLSRRELLLTGASLAAAGLASRAPAFESPLQAPKSWSDIRGLFDLDPSQVHMAGLLLASHPRPVKAAIERYRKMLDENPVQAWHDLSMTGEEDARAAAARYINGRPEDIALTDSTSQALAVLYNGVTIRDDQHVLTTIHDHQATHATLGTRSQRTGMKVRRVQLYTPGTPISPEEIASKLAAEIQPSTRVVAVTWVHSSTGMRLPIPLLAEAVRKANEGRKEEDRALLCVDGVHGFGVEDLDIQAMGCDFFAAGCHKWIFGPRGTGILWGKPETQAAVKPCMVSFSGNQTWGRALTPGGFHSFEHRWALPEAFELHLQIGKPRVRARIHELARQAKEGLAKMSNVKLYTPMADELSAGLVCFDVKGMLQQRVVEKLGEKRIIASTTPYLVSYARLTPGLLNTPEEVDRTLAAIRELAQ